MYESEFCNINKFMEKNRNRKNIQILKLRKIKKKTIKETEETKNQNYSKLK